MAQTTQDGGPAFPGMVTHQEFSEELGRYQDVILPAGGITIRDYFAAHAPRKAHAWFQPAMPPRPVAKFDHDHPNLPGCMYLDCSTCNFDELLAYDTERIRQRDRQWPYAYADAMLAERAK